MIITIAVVAIFVVALVFAVARSLLIAAQAKREKDEVQEERDKIERQRLELCEQNERIQDQLLLARLNDEQVAIVEANSTDLDRQIPDIFKLKWQTLVFEGRLGSGSFGDCFKGT